MVTLYLPQKVIIRARWTTSKVRIFCFSLGVLLVAQTLEPDRTDFRARKKVEESQEKDGNYDARV